MTGRPYLTALILAGCTLTGLIGMMIADEGGDHWFLAIAFVPLATGVIAWLRRR